MKRLIFALMFLVLSGCGTGYYDALFEQHLKEIELASQFSVLYPGLSQIPGTNLGIRLPKVFDKPYNKNSTYSFDPNGEIDPERLNPPFLNPFPGLVNCYEVFAKESTGENLPYYLYTGVRVLAPEGKAALEQELLGKLKAIVPTASLDDVQAVTPRGAKVAWKKIAITMPQSFFPSGKGRTGGMMQPGVFELWFYEAPTGLVMLGWRAPETLAEQVKLNGLATLTAGTLEVKPEEAKPAVPAAADAAAPAQP
ncbi:MAG TPA: hypothetical protein VGG30_03155 [Pirellulales bacterium]|jgi:hypothetical protein